MLGKRSSRNSSFVCESIKPCSLFSCKCIVVKPMNYNRAYLSLMQAWCSIHDMQKSWYILVLYSSQTMTRFASFKIVFLCSGVMFSFKIEEDEVMVFLFWVQFNFKCIGLRFRLIWRALSLIEFSLNLFSLAHSSFKRKTKISTWKKQMSIYLYMSILNKIFLDIWSWCILWCKSAVVSDKAVQCSKG